MLRPANQKNTIGLVPENTVLAGYLKEEKLWGMIPKAYHDPLPFLH
jgi:hypothetical protein